MHDGSMQTLWDVMDHYNKGGEANPYLDGGIEPLALSEAEIDQLVAFMFTLTDRRFQAESQAAFAAQQKRARTTRPFRDNALAQRQVLPFQKRVMGDAGRRTDHATTAWSEEHRDQALRGARRVLRRPAQPRPPLVPQGVGGRGGRRRRQRRRPAPALRSCRSTSPTRGPNENFRIAYISDSHLYEQKVNERFVRSLLRAVDDVNKLDPQPDFVLFGGDLAQLGHRGELDIGAQILKNVKAPMHMMVGEHDWFLDMGEHWQSPFGPPTYSFDHKGVHFVVLNSIHEKDFWTARKLTPTERMHIVAGLDNAQQGRFMVGEEQRNWLQQDLAKISPGTPLIVFSHSPLYKYYEPWNFWTDDADEVQAILKRWTTPSSSTATPTRYSPTASTTSTSTGCCRRRGHGRTRRRACRRSPCR